MYGRPTWHHDHPPACTCFECSQSRAGRKQARRIGRQTSGRMANPTNSRDGRELGNSSRTPGPAQATGHTPRTTGGSRRGNGRLILALLILIAVIVGLGVAAYRQGMLPFEIQLVARQPVGDNAPPVAPVLYAPTDAPRAATAIAATTPIVKTKAAGQPPASGQEGGGPERGRTAYGADDLLPAE